MDSSSKHIETKVQLFSKNSLDEQRFASPPSLPLLPQNFVLFGRPEWRITGLRFAKHHFYDKDQRVRAAVCPSDIFQQGQGLHVFLFFNVQQKNRSPFLTDGQTTTTFPFQPPNYEFGKTSRFHAHNMVIHTIPFLLSYSQTLLLPPAVFGSPSFSPITNSIHFIQCLGKSCPICLCHIWRL